MIDERIVINPAEIEEAIVAIRVERDRALDAMEAINNEYDFLSETMASDTLGAAREFQIAASQLFAKVNETIRELEAIAAQYSANSIDIDRAGATGISNT